MKKVKKELTKNQRSRRYYLFLTVFVTGGAVMMLELLGTRIIGPYYGVSLYVWSSLITVTLIFLAVGYWLGGLLADRVPKVNLLYVIVLLSGVFILLIPLMASPVLKASNSLGLRLGALGSSFLLFSIPMLLLGMVSPYAIKLQADKLNTIGLTAGRLYAVSTLGSFVGTILTGFVLIPNLGVTRIVYLLALTLFILSGVWFVASRRYIGAFLALILVAVCLPNLVAGPELIDKDGIKVLDKTESLYGQIKVVDKGNIRWLLVDGSGHNVIDKRNGLSGFEYTHYLQLLHLYRPEAERLLLIGLGGGIVARNFSRLGLSIDIAEIEPRMEQVARKFFGFSDEDGQVYVQDGRCFIEHSRQRYDFIILDAYGGGTPPFQLFSLEAFQQMKRLLSEDGIVAVNYIGFMEGRRSLPAKSLFRTLGRVFPSVRAHYSGKGEGLGSIVFFASPGSLEPGGDIDSRIDRTFENELTRILLHKMLKRRIDFLPEEGIVITDDYNPLELWGIEANEAWREAVFENFPKEVLLN